MKLMFASNHGTYLVDVSSIYEVETKDVFANTADEGIILGLLYRNKLDDSTHVVSVVRDHYNPIQYATERRRFMVAGTNFVYTMKIKTMSTHNYLHSLFVHKCQFPPKSTLITTRPIPLPNSYSTGGICLGSSPRNFPPGPITDTIEQVINTYWMSTFRYDMLQGIKKDAYPSGNVDDYLLALSNLAKNIKNVVSDNVDALLWNSATISHQSELKEVFKTVEGT